MAQTGHGLEWALRERQPCRCLARQKSDAPSMQPVAAEKNPMEKKTVACSLHVITCLLSQIKTGSVLQISTTFSTSFNCFVDQTYGNLNGLLSIIVVLAYTYRTFNIQISATNGSSDCSGPLPGTGPWPQQRIDNDQDIKQTCVLHDHIRSG